MPELTTNLTGSGSGVRTRAVLPLIESEGAELYLTLVRADGSRVSVLLGAGEAVALALDLLQAARAWMGRANSPPKPEGSD